jgi:protein-tyrosine phosphatase
MKRVSILFVCMGNICRSPLAEGIFAHLVDEAGVADRPDRRSIATAQNHGVDISRQRARQIKTEDFNDFDLILAMDRANMAELRRMAPQAENIRLFGDLALETGEEIPDPYYGGSNGFALVYARLFAGCRKLLDALGADSASWSGKTSSVR